MLNLATADWTAFTDELVIKPLSKLCSMITEKRISNVHMSYVRKKISISFRLIWLNHVLLLRKGGKMTWRRRKSKSEDMNVSNLARSGLIPGSRLGKLQFSGGLAVPPTELAGGLNASITIEVLKQTEEDQFFFTR